MPFLIFLNFIEHVEVLYFIEHVEVLLPGRAQKKTKCSNDANGLNSAEVEREMKENRELNLYLKGIEVVLRWKSKTLDSAFDAWVSCMFERIHNTSYAPLYVHFHLCATQFIHKKSVKQP